MELSKSTIYINEYFYSTLNGDDVEYRALSYKELETIQNKYVNKRNQSQIITVKTALLNDEDFYLLTGEDLNILYVNIMNVSLVTNEDLSIITEAISILLEDAFKDDTFKSCKLCQERGLDKQRNCPFLSEKTYDPMVFYIIDNKKVNVCPMDKVNSPLIGDALRCHSIAEGQFLPSAGGMYDQTMFFVESSNLVKGLMNSHQAKAMDKN